MRAFVWDQRFVTGIALVDQQHKHLDDLANETGELLLQGSCSDQDAKRIFDDLAHYAHVHFAAEEALMRKRGVDPRHVEVHTRHHQDFVEQLTSMWRRLEQTGNPAETLQVFLAAWLTVHILGEDQIMARMMTDIEQGMSPAHAYEREYIQVDNSVSALLDALNNLNHSRRSRIRNWTLPTANWKPRSIPAPPPWPKPITAWRTSSMNCVACWPRWKPPSGNCWRGRKWAPWDAWSPVWRTR